MTLALKTPEVGGPNIAGMHDMDVPNLSFDSPNVHSAALGGAGTLGNAAWTAKMLNKPGRVASLGAYNLRSDLNFNTSNQFSSAPPISGR